MRARHEKPPNPAQAWLPRRDTTILLLSTSVELQGEVGRVSAAAAVELIVGGALEHVGGRWEDVAAVLIDARTPWDGAVQAGLAGWRGPTVMVGFTADAPEVWLQAERRGADRVAILPDSAPWLANFLGRLRNPAHGAGVVGVVGGCGGAGASTLAILLAAEAARRGTRTLLVDGDPWGGGLAAALSLQELPGLRWQDLLQASGSINPEQLAASLPPVAGFSLLSWSAAPEHGVRSFGQGNASAAPVAELMRAARGAYGLVVVDVGRSPTACDALAQYCSGMLLVLPGQVRAAAAAREVVRACPPMPMAAVVRGPLVEGVDAAMVAAAVELPLAGSLPGLAKVAATMAAQRLPELLRQRRTRMLLGRILAWMSGPGTDFAVKREYHDSAAPA
ncbi:septum site-determining protein Ssd [Specibacter sp. NPDC057265]|uniref:septum site-determining protein Ssd n=1 Tax=Specibacter sp. NPDC057265 TaxID=3346075 RepID=UPI003637CD1A